MSIPPSAARYRATLSSTEGVRTVLLEMAETYERIADAAERDLQAVLASMPGARRRALKE